MELLALRTALGWSQRRAAAESGFSGPTLSRWETGERAPRVEHLASLLTTYRVPADRRDELVELAQYPHGAYWTAVGMTARQWQLQALLEYERTADQITVVAPLLVPGLLQTGRYTRAIMVAAGVPERDITTRVAVRVGRSDAITKPHPARLVAVLGEWVLRQRIGSTEVMREQVQRLADMVSRSNVDLRVLPLRCVWSPALEGQFVLLEGGQLGAAVHVESRQGGLFLHEPADMDAYREARERVLQVSMTAAESAALVEEVIAELYTETEIP